MGNVAGIGMMAEEGRGVKAANKGGGWTEGGVPYSYRHSELGTGNWELGTHINRGA